MDRRDGDRRGLGPAGRTGPSCLPTLPSLAFASLRVLRPIWLVAQAISWNSSQIPKLKWTSAERSWARQSERHALADQPPPEVCCCQVDAKPCPRLPFSTRFYPLVNMILPRLCVHSRTILNMLSTVKTNPVTGGLIPVLGIKITKGTSVIWLFLKIHIKKIINGEVSLRALN